MNNDPGTFFSPENDYDPTKEASKYVLQGELDSITDLSIKKRRLNAFTVSRLIIELANSQAMGHIRTHATEWVGEAAKDKKNLKRIALIGGAALALVAARQVIGPNWDDKIHESLKHISESIKEKKTTFFMEAAAGAEGQSEETLERLELLQSSLESSSDRIDNEPSAGYLVAGFATVRRAVGRVPFLKDRNPDE